MNADSFTAARLHAGRRSSCCRGSRRYFDLIAHLVGPGLKSWQSEDAVRIGLIGAEEAIDKPAVRARKRGRRDQ